MKAILDAAAGDSASDYGGAGRFWDDGVEKLKAARVYGVAMIAPEQAAPCCEPESRSARSGLIRGLRGQRAVRRQRAFRRCRGAARASPTPTSPSSPTGSTTAARTTASRRSISARSRPRRGKVTRLKVADVAEFERRDRARKRYAYRDGEPRQRAEHRLPDEPRDRASCAARSARIYELNKWPEDRRNYNNQALIHQNHCQHGWERFLPWHRAYLYEFEQNLQDFDRDLMLPYWDWTMPQYRPDEPDKGCIIPQAFKAFLTPDAVDAMIGALKPKPTPAQADGIPRDGRARAMLLRLAARVLLLRDRQGRLHGVTPSPTDKQPPGDDRRAARVNALWYPLRYPAEYAGDRHDQQGDPLSLPDRRRHRRRS